MSISLVPAIIPFAQDLVVNQINDIKSFSDTLQIDIGDNTFTDHATLQASDFSISMLSGLSVELHAMVENPFSICDAWIALGIKRLVVHVETSPTAQQLQTLHARGVTPVVGMKATTPLAALEPYTHLVSSYLFLTIDPPGHQGGILIPEALEKVREFHERFPAFEITVDGGANTQTLNNIVEAGAQRIVVGSALQEGKRFLRHKFEELNNIINAKT